MSNHALLASPLGAVLVQSGLLPSGRWGLSALHFVDQADCPRLDCLKTPETVLSGPGTGLHQGRPAKNLKMRQQDSLIPGTTAPGFDPGLIEGHAAMSGLKALLHQTSLLDSGQEPANGPAMVLLQSNTPAAANQLFTLVAQQLKEYWLGQRHSFTIELSPKGSAFQQKIWSYLLEIPYGHTWSYGELAQKAGYGAGYGRAAGSAVGSNPISVIIPCHRVLAQNNTLNGYGGGLARKLALLQLEGLDFA